MPRGIWTEKMLCFNVCAKFGRNCNFLLQNKSTATEQRPECGRSYPCWPLSAPRRARAGRKCPSPPGGSPASPRGSSAFGLLTTDRLEAPGESQPPQRTAVQNFPWMWPWVSGRELSFNQESPPRVEMGPCPLGEHPPLCPRQNSLGKTTPMSHPPRRGSELGNRQAECTWGHEVWAQVGGADPACSLRLCPPPGGPWPPVSGLGLEGCPPHLHMHLTQTWGGDTSEDEHVRDHR